MNLTKELDSFDFRAPVRTEDRKFTPTYTNQYPPPPLNRVQRQSTDGFSTSYSTQSSQEMASLPTNTNAISSKPVYQTPTPPTCAITTKSEVSSPPTTPNAQADSGDEGNV